jgi:3-hydroxy-9,10-secoandrosta-1,3,5(10)-triene-9,17-dione monooxygenase
MLERARALVPEIAERALATESARRVPDATMDAFRAAGLLRLLQPKRAGGYELDFGVLVDVCAELARGCASSAWVLTNLASHGWMLGMWPLEAQDEVWPDGAGDTAIGASLVFPAGRALLQEGGYRLHGSWAYASGIDVCDWVMLGAIVDGDEENPGEYRLFLLPRSDYAVHDTWFVAGLAGTGSKEVSVSEVFVPLYRTLPLRATQGGPTPGSAANPGALYRIPLLATFGYVVVGVPLGIARGALEQFSGENRRRLASSSGRALVDYAPVQWRIAESSANLDAARQIVKRNCEEIMRIAAGTDEPTLEQKGHMRRDSAFAARLCTRAVDLLFEASGGAALYLSHPMQRAFRDAHAAASHIALNWDAAATAYGRIVLGRAGDMPPYER